MNLTWMQAQILPSLLKVRKGLFQDIRSQQLRNCRQKLFLLRVKILEPLIILLNGRFSWEREIIFKLFTTPVCYYNTKYLGQIPSNQVWKSGIRVTLRGIAISADYIENFRGAESGQRPVEVDGKVRVIGPAAPVMERGGKHV